MFQSNIPFHETGKFTSRRTFLPDKEYGIALDNLVKGCSDMILIHPDGQRIFVGKRCVQPQPDWWFIGGRIFPGETPIECCQRLLLRELGLNNMESHRFQPICAQAFVFNRRQQPPVEHGTADVQLCFSVQLQSEEEVQKVVLDPMEYSDGCWKKCSEVLADGGGYHPALKYAVRCLLASQTLNEMVDCDKRSREDNIIAKRDIEDDNGRKSADSYDTVLANLTREFLKRRRDIEEMMIQEKGDYELESKELNYCATVDSRY